MFKRIKIENKKKFTIILISILAAIALIVGLGVGLGIIASQDPLPMWVSDTFRGIQAALVAIMALSCIIIIIGVLASPPQTGAGNNVITGAAESYYTKNKGKNNQGRIRTMIVICAAIVAVCAILYFVLFSIYTGQYAE